MLGACILWKVRPATAACSKLWASSLLSQGRPPFTTPCQLLHYLHSSTESVTAHLPISMHLAQLHYQPSNPFAHAETSTAPSNNSLLRIGTASVPRSLPAIQPLSTRSSTSRQQTSVASVSALTHLHAASASNAHVSLPEVISGSVLSHAAVPSTQESTLLSWLGELKLPTSVPAPNKQLTTNPARLRCSYQPPCLASWSLSLPAQSCSLTASPCGDPQTSEGAAAPQLDLAASAQQRSAQLQVHAETRLLSIPASNLAGSTCTSPAATFAPSYMRPSQRAPLSYWRQTKQTQHSSVPPHHALLHTTAVAASRPADAQPQPQTSAVSATSEPQGGEKREPVQLQQHATGSQEGRQGGDEAGRGVGAQAVEGQRVVLYKGRYMLAFRMLVRFKIFQLVGIAALAIPINTFLAGGDISSIQMVMATALVIGCGVASTTLWWFSQRYVGEMSLVVPNKLCFSVLDFWGNRQDTVVSIEQLIPPMQRLSQKEKTELIHQTVFPLDVSADRQYLISLRHGVLVDKQKLVELLTEGTVSQQQ